MQDNRKVPGAAKLGHPVYLRQADVVVYIVAAVGAVWLVFNAEKVASWIKQLSASIGAS